MKFRIKHIKGIGYWPQVKKGCVWSKIGDHGDQGFGLYEESDISHPYLNEDECREIITAFNEWVKLKTQKPTYIEVEI